jgi:hypothetical protein
MISLRLIAGVHISPLTVATLKLQGYDIIRTTDTLPATALDKDFSPHKKRLHSHGTLIKVGANLNGLLFSGKVRDFSLGTPALPPETTGHKEGTTHYRQRITF